MVLGLALSATASSFRLLLRRGDFVRGGVGCTSARFRFGGMVLVRSPRVRKIRCGREVWCVEASARIAAAGRMCDPAT